MYVQDTLADWEPGFATSQLNSGSYFRDPGESRPVKTFGLTKVPAVTAGGVTVMPDLTIEEVSPDGAALLMLIGGDTWFEAKHGPVLEKARSFLAADIPVAAICGATVALAQAGFLDHQPHTSNDLGYLKATCPAYAGEAHFKEEPAVTAGNLITASGVAPLEFAYHILRKLDVFRTETLEAWYRLYSTHEGRYFFELMQSLPERAGA